MSEDSYSKYINYLVSQIQLNQQLLLQTQIYQLFQLYDFENPYQAIFFFSIIPQDKAIVNSYEKKFQINLDHQSLEAFKNYYLHCELKDVRSFENEGHLELFLLYHRNQNNNKLIEEVVKEYYCKEYTFKDIMDKYCQPEIENWKYMIELEILNQDWQV